MTNLKVREFHIADYIETPADIAAFLMAVAEDAEGNPGELLAALSHIHRARSQMAEVANLSENGTPSLEAFVNLLRALGLRLRIEAA